MAINPQILAKIFGGNAPQGMDPEMRQQVGMQSLGAMGAAMLANSRTNSGSAPGFGQVLGQGLQAGMQAQQQGIQNAQLQQMRQYQIDQAEAEAKRRENLKRMIGGGQNYEGQGFAGQAATEAAPSALPQMSESARRVLMSLSPQVQEQVLTQQSGITPKVETLGGEEAQKLGLPEGSLVQRDPITGKVSILREGWDEEAFRQQQAIQYGYQSRLANEKAALTAQSSLSAKEEQINRLMQVDPNMTRAQAVGIVDGRYVTSRDPISGRAQIIDKATGKVLGDTSDAVSEVAAGTPTGPQQTMIDPSIDFAQGTGGDAVFNNMLNMGADLFGLGLPAPDTEAAIQSLNNLSTQTQVALAQEVAGRPTNMLLEQFRDMAVKPAAIMQGDERAREKLRATKSLIDQKKAMVQDILQNPDQYRPNDVSTARQNYQQLQMLSQQYDAAMQSFGKSERQQRSGPGSVVPGSQGTPRTDNVPTIEINQANGQAPAGEPTIDDLVRQYGG